MFHTSSYRHEQYIKRTKSTRSTGSSTLSPIKRCSIESEISRTDSGYASCTSNSNHKQDISLTDSNDSLFTSSMTESSTESRRASEESAILNALKQHEQQKELNKATTSTTTTASHHKKSKKGKSQIPGQPDLVYSCPRPLAFPFHNDDQFLPIAEADPRDVARVSPSSQHHPSRSQSLSSSSTNSVKQKILTYDRFGTFKSYHSTTTTSQKPLSFNDNTKGGTVRSLRSIFQLPDSSSFLSNSNSSNKNPISFNVEQQQQQLEVQVDEPQHPYALKKLEIKKGTVQSIKDIFTNLSNKDGTGSYSTSPPHSVTSKGMPPRKQSNHRVGATIRQYDSKVTTTVFRPDNNNSSESQYTPPPPPLSSTALKKEKHFTRKAFEFASNIWKKKDVDATPQKKSKKSDSELPKTTTTNLITTEIKNFSVRILALPAAWLNSNTTEQKQEKDKNHNDEEEEGQEHEHKQDTTISKNDATTTTTVGKLWKSFKRLVVGKKTSRVGVL